MNSQSPHSGVSAHFPREMRRAKAISLSLALVAISAISDIAQAVTMPSQMIVRMGRGSNIGNVLEGTGFPTIPSYYFDDLQTMGYTSVRLPVGWSSHASTTAPYTIDPNWLSNVKSSVDTALAHGFVTVINAHRETLNGTNYNTEITRFQAIWTQIASYFQSEPEDLVFEIFNEPNPDSGWSSAQVNDLNSRILSIIRATNPTRIVKLAVPTWNRFDSLHLLTPPSDPYLLAEVHYYDPGSFVFNDSASGTVFWGSASDKATVASNFATMVTWSKQSHIPVIVGEFGAENPHADRSSLLQYYATVAQDAIGSGLAFTVWDDGGWFKILNRNGSHTWDTGLLASVMTPSSLLHFETESLSVAAQTSGITERVGTDVRFSGSAGTFLDSTAANQFVTYTVPNIAAGTYDVRVGMKKLNTRGMWQLAISRMDSQNSPTNLGSPVDEYASVETFAEVDMGNWSPGSTSDKAFKFTVTGKNASSTGYSLSFDYIRLIPQ